MLEMITLNQAFPNGILGEGIFENMINPPWSEVFTADELDLQFFSEYGEKPVAPIISKFYVEPTGLTEEVRIKISNILLNRYKVQWKHKFDLLSVEYNPINNYNIREESIDTNTGTNIDSGSNTETGTTTETGTDTLQVTTNGRRDTTVDRNNSVYGFNSVEAVDSDITNGVSAETVTDSRTDSRSLDLENGININRTNENTKTLDLTHEHESTRSGNLGFMTPQKMIQSEIDLWKWDFIKDVFDDISNIITLPIYKIEI